MGFKTYKATEYLMRAAQKLLGFRLRVTGAEQLPDRPTMFVSNHFTQIETFLTPYALFIHSGRQVRSLAHHGIFKGWLGSYFERLGGMSIRAPRRNTTIIRELMTGKHDWLIYPEGGLIKNKKLIKNDRLHLERPTRTGPPHTGAAMMALKAEASKRRYLDAWSRGEKKRMAFYQEKYGLTGPEDVCRDGIVIVPVNITFYPLRPGLNFLNRMVRRFSKDLDPRFEEELLVEGSILMGGAEIIIHFGEPIEVSDYMDRPTHYARKLVGMFSEMRGGDLAMRRQARRLTEASIRTIYRSTEINLDHLFSAALYEANTEVINVADFHRALYVTASKLAADATLRVHPSFHNGIASLLTQGEYWPLDSIVEYATESGILTWEGDRYLVNLEALHDEHDFHQIRLRNPIRVLANELQPIKPAMKTLRKALELTPIKLRNQTRHELINNDMRRFEHDYEQWS
ncbi:MAG: 1-acyl-sn-glycerol-3-phosphate acyltransferase, partial [Planctomycetota bacterium]|nr:1-acyl-sn-glycerol-3-phosphate acyltransferase [Planctomycetota bacterium]